jgi:adenylate kinase family enzyme
MQTAANRNKVRVVCETCRRPLLVEYYPVKNPKHCPVCGGKLIRRIDDDPAKFKVRTKEYETRTKPVMELLKKRGYKIAKIDGTPAPYRVFQKIAKLIGE